MVNTLLWTYTAVFIHTPILVYTAIPEYNSTCFQSQVIHVRRTCMDRASNAWLGCNSHHHRAFNSADRRPHFYGDRLAFFFFFFLLLKCHVTSVSGAAPLNCWDRSSTYVCLVAEAEPRLQPRASHCLEAGWEPLSSLLRLIPTWISSIVFSSRGALKVNVFVCCITETCNHFTRELTVKGIYYAERRNMAGV